MTDAAENDNIGSPPPNRPVARFRPIAPERLSDGVVEQFRQMLLLGQLVPGQRLPNERELGETFGISRNSVREALRQLELLTLVERRRGDGTYVRELDVVQLMAPFGAVIASSASAVGDVLEFRRTFEPQVAALAAVKADNEGRVRLRRSLRDFDSALGARGAGRADVDFHFTVALATRNAVVIGVQRALMEVMAHFRAHLGPSGYDGSVAAARGHGAIVDAIVDGDPTRARHAATLHLDDVARLLQEADAEN
jgi:GntR family transcriptional regulator, transcriptional repressor for pyruvate dehydrogenase complex